MTRFAGFTRLIGAAVLAGLLSGLGAIPFHFVADNFGEALYRATSTGDWMQRRSDPASAFELLRIGPCLGHSCCNLCRRSRIGEARETIDSIRHDGGVVPLVRVLNVALSALGALVRRLGRA